MTGFVALAVVVAGAAWVLCRALPVWTDHGPPLTRRLEAIWGQDGAGDLSRGRAGVSPPVALAGLVLDDVGRWLQAALARAGFDAMRLERKLARVAPGRRLSQFRGMQLMLALAGLALVPFLNLFALAPPAGWPLPLALLPAAAAGYAPVLWVDIAAWLRAAQLRAELPVAIDLLGLKLSAGLPPRSALLEVAQELPAGVCASGLRSVVQAVAIGEGTLGEGLRTLSEREDAGELRVLADAWLRSEREGVALGASLLVLRRTLRERWQRETIERVRRSIAKMTLPVMMVLPALLIVILYPVLAEMAARAGQ